MKWRDYFKKGTDVENSFVLLQDNLWEKESDELTNLQSYKEIVWIEEFDNNEKKDLQRNEGKAI